VTALDPHAFLESASIRLRAPLADATPPYRFGVDLGTATIVLTVIDAEGKPAYWDFSVCRAVRDGVVVDFAAAVREVAGLVARANESLSVRIVEAATAYPPCIAEAEARACRYVLEQAGVACRLLTDEVSAAQALVRIANGALVDVGGGSTGVGVFRDGRLVTLSDAAGGGHHLDLIVAGALHLSIEEAESRKRSGTAEIAALLVPGIERIGETIRRAIAGRGVREIHLVGGALMIGGAADVIARYVGVKTVAYPHAHLITPFGMALLDG
jgi:ethanolamine utilization protein EutJ